MTEWWAFKPVTTAFEKTRKLLLEPFDAWTWLKLIIITFFVGTGGTGSSRISSNFNDLVNYRAGPADTQAIEQGINSVLSNTALILIILALIALAIALVLLFAYLRNVFSFVFIRALASGDARIIKPMMDNLGRGFRLFLFTLLVGLVTFAVVVALIVAMILCIFLALGIGVSGISGLIVLMLAIPVVVILLLIMIAISTVSAIFVGFTYDFVAPMVYFKNMGILESWKWLWASIKKDWQQYGVYVLARWALEFVVGILMMIIVLPVALIFIAILLAGIVVAIAAAELTVVLSVFVGVVLLVLLAIFILAMMAISMPVAVYFRYYSLDVLKQIDPSAVLYAERFTPPPPPSMLPA